jgi:hypothetical protein
LEPEFLADDGDEDVDGDGDPDLRFHRVGRSAIEGFDTKMLFDPFEEQFDLLRIPVKSATHSDFGRTLIPVISDTYRSVATLAV